MMKSFQRNPLAKSSRAVAALLFLIAITPAGSQHLPASGPELQRLINAAPNYGTLTADRDTPLVLSEPLVIRKPLTLQGINAELPASLGKSPLIVIEAEGVAITDFELRGNADSVTQEDRSALLVVRAGSFRIERGVFLNSAKDGVMVDGAGAPERDITGGIIRDIVGRGNVRDLVSIGGGGEHGRRIRNVLVDNVRAYDSRLRGAVEVSDGTEDITVRNVYAENCVYAIDVQDHGKPLQINTNVLIQGVTAVDCIHILRTANGPHGHAGLTVRDAVGVRCAFPIRISNTRDVTLDNVRIAEHPAGDKPPIAITKSDGVSVRDMVIRASAHAGPGLRIENSGDVRIDGVNLLGGENVLTNAVLYRVSEEATFKGLRVRNVVSGATPGPGILLEKANAKAALSGISISDNASSVENQFRGELAASESSIGPGGPSISPLAGQTLIPSDVDWKRPLYETAFDDPEELRRWSLEGGKRAVIEDGLLVLESAKSPEGDAKNHLVFWLDKEFPADFLLEFTIRPQNRKEGLAIVFFNARGMNGENIFDPALDPRDGLFRQYHSGDLNNYHISYWAGSRGTANIRKNAGFNLVATGPDLIGNGPADSFQTVRVYKRDGSIRLIVDDVVSAAWDDDGIAYGPVHTHGGWIGLRQMEHAVRCDYDHFAVYPLIPQPV